LNRSGKKEGNGPLKKRGRKSKKSATEAKFGEKNCTNREKKCPGQNGGNFRRMGTKGKMEIVGKAFQIKKLLKEKQIRQAKKQPKRGG